MTEKVVISVLPAACSEPQQLCVLLLGQQSGHIIVGLVEGQQGLFVPLDALLGQNQLLEPGVLRHAQPLDVAPAPISCKMFVTVERVMENSRSMSRWNTGSSRWR